MTSTPVDPTLALESARQSDLVQKKIQMDSLRKRLGDTKSEEQKLKESCEGFESIFLQKMWEQMRKNVPKSGYLHSRDEETYQSLFDVELSKKMASAGGIGLADMLYEQLSQQVTATARRTVSETVAPTQKDTMALQTPTPAIAAPKERLGIEDLYTDLPDTVPFEKVESGEPKIVLHSSLAIALDSLQADVAKNSSLQTQDIATASASFASAQAFSQNTPPLRVDNAVTENEKDTTANAQTTQIKANDLRSTSWHNPTKVSVKDTPFRGKNRQKNTPKDVVSINPQLANQAKQNETLATQNRANEGTQATKQSFTTVGSPHRATEEIIQQAQTLAQDFTASWPHDGQVISRFGWDQGNQKEERRWNSGIAIAAKPGDPVKALLDGKVIYSGPREGYGHTVVLEHADGYLSYYGNVAAKELQVGTVIKGGTSFASVATVTPVAPNEENYAALHFEMKRGEMALNPEHAIKKLKPKT